MSELNLFFLFFSTIALISALMVINVRNPVHSVLFLVLCIFNVACLLVMLGTEFMAMLFIIVYVGAIATLFLFVVMMLNINLTERIPLPIGSLVGFLFLFDLFLVIISKDFLSPLFNLYKEEDHFLDWSLLIDSVSNVETIGQVVYTYNILPFIMSGLILLIAMIGAIILTMRPNEYIKRQQIFQQVSRNFNNTTFLINK